MAENYQVGPAAQDDCVEAELVHDGSGPRPEDPFGGRQGPFGPAPRAPFGAPPPQPAGILARIRGALATGLLLLAAGLLILGAILTSTVIGAIVGLPLMMLGGALLWLFFRLFAADLRGRFVFRKFP